LNFVPLALAGAYLLEPRRTEDGRGHFARTWCVEEARAHGLEPAIAQCSLSWNLKRGTLRGMHYQRAPFEEVKVVRCVRGALVDVLLDLRPKSRTFGHWEAVELTEDNGLQVYVPAGFAHGFQTLRDGTEVHYQISTPYHPEAAAGVRWNDPAFGILWPLADPILSPRDAAFPDFHP
jgi:dTDP-4-dehydrorhamnose 3,5-epimerase